MQDKYKPINNDRLKMKAESYVAYLPGETLSQEGILMKYIGNAESAANGILNAFKSGAIPEAIKTIFINRKDSIPCREWSWSNQVICILNGTTDARGYRQWETVKRYVKEGEHAFFILAPLFRVVKKDDGKEESFLYGFKSVPVFGVEQTDGAELPKSEICTFIDSLPLIEVARKWGLNVEVFNGRQHGHHGLYRPGQLIAIGVENLSTWAHELMHAADHKLGNLKERGQHYRSETVAEFGGAVLLHMLGMEHDADKGGCWEYISAYCQREGKEPISVCMSVLKRVCDAIEFILTESEAIKQASNAIVQEIAA
jgi:hypothetical protein